MGRRKVKHTDQLLTRPILFRVSEPEYERLDKLRRESDCHSLGEVIRRILQHKPITLFHRDRSLEGPLEELARIREELRAIGVNINQLTRHFHGSTHAPQRLQLAHQVLTRYQQVEGKVRLLLTLISQLASKW